MTVFIILQVVINPRNHAIPFSIVFGSDKRINYPGNPCDSIEIVNFDPTHNITVILTTSSSINLVKTVEPILVNNTLEVGNNPDLLSYYGVPVVAIGDEVSLYVRALDRASAPQSVGISVYDLNGFTQINASSLANPQNVYNFDKGCLLSPTGCVASPAVESEGWFYFIFESDPTPSKLLVSLDSTIRDYDVDVSITRGGCTLDDETINICYIDTPKMRYTTRNQDNTDSTSIDYLPFSITYESNNALPYQNPPAQSLTVSTDLSWTCLRSDLWNYVIVAVVFGVIFLAVTVFIIIVCYYRLRETSVKLPSFTFNRRNRTFRPAATNLNTPRLPVVNQEKELCEFVRTESLPPAYDKLEDGTGTHEDEAPYYT